MNAANRQVQDSIRIQICIVLLFKFHRFIVKRLIIKFIYLKTLSDFIKEATQ